MTTLENITTEKELELFLKQANQLGFDFGYSSEIHKKKLESIIRKHNTLDLTIDSRQLISKLYNYPMTYNEFETAIQNHFNQFSKTDKINQLLKIVDLHKTLVKGSPKTVEETYQKLINKGYTDLGKDKREFTGIYCFNHLDLTKDTIKLSITHNNRNEFNQLIKILGFDFEIPYFSEFSKPKVTLTEDFYISKSFVEITNKKATEELKKLFIERLLNGTSHLTLLKY